MIGLDICHTKPSGYGSKCLLLKYCKDLDHLNRFNLATQNSLSNNAEVKQ